MASICAGYQPLWKKSEKTLEIRSAPADTFLRREKKMIELIGQGYYWVVGHTGLILFYGMFAAAAYFGLKGAWNCYKVYTKRGY